MATRYEALVTFVHLTEAAADRGCDDSFLFAFTAEQLDDYLRLAWKFWEAVTIEQAPSEKMELVALESMMKHARDTGRMELLAGFEQPLLELRRAAFREVLRIVAGVGPGLLERQLTASMEG